jgi:dienelactone hydrolase
MSRVSRWILVGLVMLLARPPLAGAQGSDPQGVAQAVVDNLLAGNFEAATKDFDSTMLAALPASTLETTWNAVVGQVGAFQKQLGTQTQQVGGYTVVVITLQFERATLDAQISVDTSGQVAGFYIKPGASTPSTAYEPPAYADLNAFEEQDVALNKGSEWELPGTLTVPKGDGPFPAVVLVQGSGPNDRDETIGPNKPFRDLAWGLASQGIAVLRYDKRTLVYGQKIAALNSFTVNDETVDDAVAAVELLRQTAKIDPARVFVLGHSLGGYLAPRIAQRDPAIAGIIILAGNTRPLEDLVLEQTRYLLSLDGSLSETDQQQIDALEKAVEATRHAQPGDDPSTLLFNAPPAYWIDLNAYDPVAVAQQLTQPMLILQGERDYQVTMVDFQGWKDGLGGRDNVTFKSYPDLNHLFMSGEGPGSPAEYQTAGHVAGQVIDDIASWVQAH